MAVKTTGQSRFQSRAGGGEKTGAVVFNYDLFKCRMAVTDLNTAISSYAMSERFYDEYELALCEYFEFRDIALGEGDSDPEDFFRDEDEFARFLSWFCTYFISEQFGKTLPECYYADKGKDLTPIEREILRSYGESFPGLYEVQWTNPGMGLEVKDVFCGDRFFLYDEHYSRMLYKWDLVYAGLLRVRGIYFLSGFDPIILPPRLRDEIEESILQVYRDEDGAKESMAEFFRQNSSELFAVIENAARNYHQHTHLKNADGDPLFFVTLQYYVNSSRQFLKEINASPFFIRDGVAWNPGNQKTEYIWIREEQESGPGAGNATQGVLLLDGCVLKARCNSRNRAERLKVLLADTFGKSLELKTTLYEKPQERILPSDGPVLPAPFPGEAISVNSAALKEISLRHYKGWIDEKIPALGNMTPREAMASPQTRMNLVNLLKELENQNERAIRKGLKNADVLGFPADMIRRELGL